MEIPHRSTIGQLLFNIYIFRLFILVNDIDIANYADNDTTAYVSGDKISAVLASIERPANLMFSWFTNNQIKRNKDKCYMLPSTVGILQVEIGAALVHSYKK